MPLIAAIFLLFFSLVVMFLWGNEGSIIHLLGYPTPAYTLYWIWIGMITFILGCNIYVHTGYKRVVGFIIASWWTANILMTQILQVISYRGIEQAGEPFFGYPSLLLDFVAQGAVDIISLYIIWRLVRNGVIIASAWLFFFSVYLSANIFGHLAGAWNLTTGVSEEMTAQFYEPYMFLAFTLMLMVQVIGAGGDALLKWRGSHVDLYRDMLPLVSRVFHQRRHLF